MIKKKATIRSKVSGNKKVEEERISQQFHRIQKNYSNLISDIVKEIDLIKKWIGHQTTSRHKSLNFKKYN